MLLSPGSFDLTGVESLSLFLSSFFVMIAFKLAPDHEGGVDDDDNDDVSCLYIPVQSISNGRLYSAGWGGVEDDVSLSLILMSLCQRKDCRLQMDGPYSSYCALVWQN